MTDETEEKAGAGEPGHLTPALNDNAVEVVEVGPRSKSKPKLKLVRPPPPEPAQVAPASNDPPDPPLRFSAEPLPAAEVAPSRPPEKRKRRQAPVAGALTVQFLPRAYHRACPPDLAGEELMRWYLAVQQGEELERERLTAQVQELAGISAVQMEILEQLQATFSLIRELGKGMGEVVQAVRSMSLEGLPVAPAPTQVAPAQPPALRPPAPAKGGLYDPTARRRQQQPVAVEEEGFGDPEAGGQQFTGRAAKPAPITNEMADQVVAYAKGRVPISGIPWAADQQRDIAEEVALNLLDRQAADGQPLPSRWQLTIDAGIIDRLGIDRAKGDP